MKSAHFFDLSCESRIHLTFMVILGISEQLFSLCAEWNTFNRVSMACYCQIVCFTCGAEAWLLLMCTICLSWVAVVVWAGQ